MHNLYSTISEEVCLKEEEVSDEQRNESSFDTW